MNQRAQCTIIMLAVVTPIAGIALLGLTLLGARVQGERAQRLADTAALSAARAQPLPHYAGAQVTVEPYGTGWRATVRLPSSAFDVPGLDSTVMQPEAVAIARATTTSDGRPGAVLVG